ncbi:MAG: nucleotidyltransferase domain-containing protein [Thermomicrobium sp.]|nr:nucleotidyltransferase domain-containing protein [Thermomicrobium sp.]
MPRLVAVGSDGSYARGDWGFGSDVDLLVIVEEDTTPFIERPIRYDTLSLPVPADLVVYTLEEWRTIREQPSGRHVAREVVWVWPADGQDPAAAGDAANEHPLETRRSSQPAAG